MARGVELPALAARGCRRTGPAAARLRGALERLLSHPFPCSSRKQSLGTCSIPGFPVGTWDTVRISSSPAPRLGDRGRAYCLIS